MSERVPLCGNYDAQTTNEKLKVARAFLIQGRRVIYDLAEQEDGTYSTNLDKDNGRGYYGMHPEVRAMIHDLDNAIRRTATMQE